MECQYCTEFQNGQIRRGKDHHTATRLCQATGEVVLSASKPCGDFAAAKRFWCDRREIWMEMLICKMNIQKRQNGCVTCRQGKIVDKILTPKSRFKRGN